MRWKILIQLKKGNRLWLLAKEARVACALPSVTTRSLPWPSGIRIPYWPGSRRSFACFLPFPNFLPGRPTLSSSYSKCPTLIPGATSDLLRYCWGCGQLPQELTGHSFMSSTFA